MVHVLIDLAKAALDGKAPILGLINVVRMAKLQSELILQMMVPFLFSYYGTTKSLLSTLPSAHCRLFIRENYTYPLPL